MTTRTTASAALPAAALLAAAPSGPAAFEADVSALAREFLERSVHSLRLREGREQDRLDLDAKLGEKRWSLSARASRLDERPGGRAADPGTVEEESLGLGLARPFAFGGELLLDGGTASSRRTGGPARTGSRWTSRGLSWSQSLGADLLGRRFGAEVAETRARGLHRGAQRRERLHEELLLFAGEAVGVKLDKTLLALQEEALERARRREAFVARRVRDGLSERVDLHQSRMAVLSQEELLRTLRDDVAGGLGALSAKVGREVGDGELAAFPLDAPPPPPPAGGGLADNPSLRAGELLVEAERAAVRRAGRDLLPEAALTLGYGTGGRPLPAEVGPAAAAPDPAGGRRSLRAALTLEMPLAFGRERALAQRARSRLRTAEAGTAFDRARVGDLEARALRRLREARANLSSARSRESLARRALADHNAFYRRGRASLDQVIRAEEDLIRTQRDLARYLASLRELSLSLASLRGGLPGYLAPRAPRAPAAKNGGRAPKKIFTPHPGHRTMGGPGGQAPAGKGGR